MRESFEPTPDLGKELQEAMQQKQGEALLENAKLIEEYQESEFEESVSRERGYRDRDSRYHRGRREYDGKDRESKVSPREEIVQSKLTMSMSRLLQANLLDEIRDHKDYPELIHDPEVQKVAVNFFFDFCLANRLETALKLKDIFEIPDQKCADGVAQVVKNVFEKGENLNGLAWVEPARGRGRYDDDYHPDYDDYREDSDSDESGPHHAPRVYKVPPNALEDVINLLPKSILKSPQVQSAVKDAYALKMSEVMTQRRTMGSHTTTRDIDFLVKHFDIDLAEVSSSRAVLDAASHAIQGEYANFRRYSGYGGNLKNGTEFLELLRTYEKYFVTPQFYNLKHVKELAAFALYAATLSPNSSPENLDAMKKKFHVSEKEITAEARRFFAEGMENIAKGMEGYSESTLEAMNYLKIPKEMVEEELAKSIIKAAAESKNGNFRPLSIISACRKMGLIDIFNRPDIQEVIQNYVIEKCEHLSNQQFGREMAGKWLSDDRDTKELLPVLKITPDSKLYLYLEAKALARNHYDVESGIKMFTVFFPDDTPQAEIVVKKFIHQYLTTTDDPYISKDKLDKLINVIHRVNEFGFTNSILLDPEFRSQALEQLKSSIGNLVWAGRDYYDTAEIFKKINTLSQLYNISPAAREEMVIDHIQSNSENGLSQFDAKRIELTAKVLNLNPETVKTIANIVFVSAIKKNDHDRARVIKETFGITGEIPEEAGFKGKEKEYLVGALNAGNFDQVKNVISLSTENIVGNPEVIEAAFKMWSNLISSGRWDNALELQAYIPLPDELTSSPEAKKAIVSGFLREVQRRNEEAAIKVYKEYLSDLSVAQISDLMPQTKPFVETLQVKFPAIYQKYLSSIELFISIVPYLNEKVVKILEAHPFLASALENNIQFALKLLFKYDSLDKLSKSNITELYADKEKILAEHSNTDPNSRDFRIAMQHHLMSYRRNEEIVSSMRKFGVDIEEWLNHEDEMFFELGESSNVLVSEQIQPAVDRTSESVDKAIEICRTIIAEYQKELMEGKVPTIDEAELKRQLEEMELEKDKAQQSGNEKKAQGIAKGMKNIEDQLANPKMVAAWTKFVSELSRLSIVKKDIVKLNDELKAKELEQKELDTKESNPRTRRKEQQKIKGQIEKIKKDIAEKNALLADRFNQYPGRVEDILKKVLGEDRASAIVQEINQSQGEILDHLTTDHGTIEATVNSKKESEADDTTMRISVWDRNPDVDLYMGNYTNCCIRIDSDHMGEESTIADYMTDLGIQIVGIYDEKKSIPVAAAWCWVGYDDDDNRALVIDNIEAQGYSKHKDQLQEKLKEYISNYAKKCGLGKVVQGKKNNDLIAASVESKPSYYKLGGYNRASGYFLEGEKSFDD